MTHLTPSDRIRNARACILAATAACAAADLAQLPRALLLLEGAAAEIGLAEREIRAASPACPSELQTESRLLKREVGRVLRVVDGCTATCRSLSLRLIDAPQSYTRKGAIVAVNSPLGVCGLQG
jgi:hypothetical protein